MYVFTFFPRGPGFNTAPPLMALISGDTNHDFVNVNFPVFCEVIFKVRVIL